MDHTLSTAPDPTRDLDRPVLVSTISGVPATADPEPETLEEALVADARAGLTPAQMVERKLVSLLKSNPLPVSYLKTGARNIRSR